ncbi:MAG: acetyl-CoA carboxylase biotin carboxylase subunit [Ectothiorhodospiraceae bacterium]|nr:acetyl-CoA carboxylase biotin carboxylase subunit [Ectothiorhodospiraceae bacterium]
MTINKLLIANRGEIAVRIARAAAELGIPTVAVYPVDDADALHTRVANEARELPGAGVQAYLDSEAILRLAAESGCDAIHPGYGFLSENTAFAKLCQDHGVTFVGPTAEILGLLGDKAQARELAQQCGVPVVEGTRGRTTLREAHAFRESLGTDAAVVVKAIAGGGGRGMRIVRAGDSLDDAYRQCAAEAKAAFGDAGLYVERLLEQARHVEVQIVGDGCGGVAHLWERECSLQRRNQKLGEIAPSPFLPEQKRAQLTDAALLLAREVGYRSLGTFEFLLDAGGEQFAFIEANPRLQVEHTVTEEVTGVDLVQTQLRIAGGATLQELRLSQQEVPSPAGFAVQLRVNMETMDAQGNARPAGGTLSVFEPPGGPGVRVDSFGYSGYTTNPHYDSLLAKVIVHSRSPHFGDAVNKAYRGLCQFRIDGVKTNIPFLQNLLRLDEVRENAVYTRFVDDRMAALVTEPAEPHPRLYATAGAGGDTATAGAQVQGPAGTESAVAPMQGQLVELNIAVGDPVRAGQQIAVVEAMKMQHVITAPLDGIVRHIAAETGTLVAEDQPLVFI